MERLKKRDVHEKLIGKCVRSIDVIARLGDMHTSVVSYRVRSSVRSDQYGGREIF